MPRRPTSTIPARCIERHPTSQTVWFLGTPINMSKLAQSYEPPLDIGYLSRIFRGKQLPGREMARRISAGLGMQLEPLLDELENLHRKSV